METLTSYFSGSSEEIFRSWSVPDFRDEPVNLLDGVGPPLMCLDAAILNDIPARYTIHSVPEYVFPAMGVYIDPRIVPGFKYRVRVLPYLSGDSYSLDYYLFAGEALRLDSIGRGYSRRLVFEPKNSSLCENDNVFWTDSHPGGVALELVAIEKNDVFFVTSEDNIVLGQCIILHVDEPQKEITQVIENNSVKKSVQATFECLITWLDYKTQTIKVSGCVETVKKKGEAAAMVQEITINNDSLNSSHAYKLIPCQAGCNSYKVGNASQTGIQTTYQVKDIRNTELSVIGTYVDPRITPGFKYIVRKLSSENYLFDGNASTLNSIGMGYGKRISFEPTIGTLNESNNYFWSDSNSEGYGFQPVAVEEGDKLVLEIDGLTVAHAEVIRIASRQKELLKRLSSSVIEAFYEVDLVILSNSMDNLSSQTIRVKGCAALKKPIGEKSAKLAIIRNLKIINPPKCADYASKKSCVLLPA